MRRKPSIRMLSNQLERLLDREAERDSLSMPPDCLTDASVSAAMWEQRRAEAHTLRDTQFGITSSAHCYNCGAHYCPLLARVKSPVGPSVDHGYELLYPERSLNEVLIFPCCSKECYDILERKLRIISKRRMEQWQEVRRAQALLKEVRQWLKHQDGSHTRSQSPRAESEPPMTLLT